MTNTDYIPIQFNDFATGDRISVQWFRAFYHDTEPDVWDEIEAAAAKIAKRIGQTVDIITCWRDDSGQICGGERAGIRVDPA